MLGVFPFVIMFLITSIAMLRERTTGTLERLLTTPMRKLDLLFGYGIAFGAGRGGPGGGRHRRCAYWLFGLTTAGSTGLVVLIAVANARARRGARPAVQRVRPDRVPGGAVHAGGGRPAAAAVRAVRAARPDGRLAAGASATCMPLTLRGRGAAGGRRARRADRALWRDLGIVAGVRRPGAGAGGGDPAPAHRLTSRMTASDAPAGPVDARQPGHPRGDPRRRAADLRRARLRRRLHPRHRRHAPGSTRPWSTTTSAPRRSCSWPPCRRRSTRATCIAEVFAGDRSPRRAAACASSCGLGLPVAGAAAMALLRSALSNEMVRQAAAGVPDHPGPAPAC